MNAPAKNLAEHVTRLRPDWAPEELSGFMYLEGGYSNDNFLFTYRGERYVLRAPFRQRGCVDRNVEQELVRRLEPGIAPETMAFEEASGFMISRWVAGELLADSNVTPEALTGYLAALHARLPPLERRYDPVAQAREHLEACSAPSWLERAAARLGWSPSMLVPCHNDLNPWNVIRTATGWITLDWEWAGLNDPLFDLVNLHQGAELPDQHLPGMAQTYLGMPADEDRLRACLVALWTREGTWALAEVDAGNDRPEILAQRDLALSRLRSLLRIRR